MPLGQRIAHMRPEERLGVLNLFEEPIVSPLEGLAQVVPRLAETAVPFVGHVGEDPPEGLQPVPSKQKALAGHLKFAKAHLVECGERPEHDLVGHSLNPLSSERFRGFVSAVRSSATISRSSRANFAWE